MSNLNVVTLVGNCGNTPEQREFESGSKVTKFCIGVGRWNKKTEQEVTDWVDIETFNKMGDYVKKGMKVCVNGSLVTSVYEKEDGTKVKRVYVLAKTIELMQQKKDGETAPTSTPTPEATATATEDLGGNADYPEDENTVLEAEYSSIPDDISEDEIPFN